MENTNSTPNDIRKDVLASQGQRNKIINNSTEKLRLYSLNQAKKILGIGISTLQQFISSGMIGTIQQGKRRRISYTELERFINENTQRQTSVFVPNSFTDRDVEYFVHGKEDKKDRSLPVDSRLIFTQLLETIN